MSTQQIDSVELETAITADSPAPFQSVAAKIPPELFENILTYVGDVDRMCRDRLFDAIPGRHEYVSDVEARRSEMMCLSACASTCVFWARLARQRMFEHLILRWSEDVSSLRSLFRAPQSPRIPPICDILQYIDVLYRPGGRLWFHDLSGLWGRNRVSRLKSIGLHIIGPARSAFVTASTREYLPHPLFFAAPRGLRIIFPEHCKLFLDMKNLHLPNPTTLFNLLQDCLSLRPHGVECTKLTWDQDPVLQATPSSVGLKYACPTADRDYSEAWWCTDNVLVGAMLTSVPYREFPQQHQDPHLSRLETSFLFDIISTSFCDLAPYNWNGRFYTCSNSDSDSIQANVATRLPAGTDFSLEWSADCSAKFRCIASRLPHAASTGNDVRNVTYIVMEFSYFELFRLREDQTRTYYARTWDTFLHSVRQFPHLRQIIIQSGRFCSRDILVDFLIHLGGAWFDLGELLGLYYNDGKRDEPRWVEVRLETLMDEVKQRRVQIKEWADAASEKASSSKLESGVIEEEFTASEDLQAQTNSVVACQDSQPISQTSQLAEVDILPEHIALLDEARQRQTKEIESETDAEKAAPSELASSVVAEDSGSTHDE